MRGENQIIAQCKAANPNREDISVFFAVSCSVGERHFLQSVIFFFLFLSFYFSFDGFLNALQSNSNRNTE